MKKKKIILVGAGILVLAVIAYWYFSRNRKNVIQWRTAPAEKGDIRVVVTATGSINALTTVQVGTQVTGTISKLFADYNSVVKKGQLIAMLDTTFLAAAKDEAAATLERAQTQLRQSKLEFERVKKLFDANAVAQADYDLAQTNAQSAQSQVSSAEAQLNRAKINLRYATIRAPISGTVISRSVDVGQTVVASFNTPTLFTIANDLKKMQVYANVDEADIGEIAVGQKAKFTVDAYPNDSFEGVIKQIRLQPNVVQNVVTYTVIIDVDNSDLKLLPGLTANISVVIKEKKNILKVPTSALRFTPPATYIENNSALPEATKAQWRGIIPRSNLQEGDSLFLWVKKTDAIVPHKVKLGMIEGGYAEISDDIKAGDEIIVGVNGEDNSTATKNPFMPRFSRGRK